VWVQEDASEFGGKLAEHGKVFAFVCEVEVLGEKEFDGGL
jgi:hypothetical protein